MIYVHLMYIMYVFYNFLSAVLPPEHLFLSILCPQISDNE